LTSEEKAIAVLGYGGKIFSTNDIWITLGIVDTEHYRQLIDSLQRRGILRSIISKARAQRLSRDQNINVRDVPRFTIVQPGHAPSEKEPVAKELDRPEGINRSAVGGAFRPRTKLAAQPLENAEAKIFLGNLPWGTRRDHLLSFIRDCGIDADVAGPAVLSKGYAIVELNTPGPAEGAIRRLNGALFEGRRVFARPSRD